MAKILNWHLVRSSLRKKRLSIFTPHDLTRIFGVSSVAAGFFVFRNAKKGLLVRLKKAPQGSLYCLADDIPNHYWIANRIYEPSYISFDAALSFHDIIPEAVYAITSATTKATREFAVNNVSFIFHRIKQSVYTGYKPQKYLGNTILMASPEKAMADVLYFVALRKRQFTYERLNLHKLRKSRLCEFAGLYNQPSIFVLIKQIYADFRRPSRIY